MTKSEFIKAFSDDLLTKINDDLTFLNCDAPILGEEWQVRLNLLISNFLLDFQIEFSKNGAERKFTGEYTCPVCFNAPDFCKCRRSE